LFFVLKKIKETSRLNPEDFKYFKLISTHQFQQSSFKNEIFEKVQCILCSVFDIKGLIFSGT